MNQTVYEKGVEKGIEKGRRIGRLELVLSLLEERFRPLPQATSDHLESLSLDELHNLALKVGAASSLADLGLPE